MIDCSGPLGHVTTAALPFDTETVACPLCGSEDAEFLGKAKDRLRLTNHDFTNVRCVRCRLVYQNPRVTPTTIAKFYPTSYYSSRPGRNDTRQSRSEAKVRRQCNMATRTSHDPGRLLEVGSANGDFLVGMRTLGWEVEGVEISSDAAEFSRTMHHLRVFHGQLTDRPDDGGQFDLIAFWGVLPHIPNPVPVISSASRLLAPGGRVLICCANIDSFAAHYMDNKWGHWDLPRHYCMWSPDTLRILLQGAGIAVTGVVHHDDVFHSNLTLRPLYRMARLSDHKQGITVRKVVKAVARCVNRVLTRPILAAARRKNRGGIVTVVGQKGAGVCL